MKSATFSRRPPLRGREVIFIVPVAPAFSENGLAMRAASLLEAMQGEGASVRMGIVPVFGEQKVDLAPEVASLCREWIQFSQSKSTWLDRKADQLWRLFQPWPNAAQDIPAAWLRSIDRQMDFDADTLLVVFRLSAYQFLPRRWLKRMPCWLDLDELDSAALRRSAKLLPRNSTKDEVTQLSEQADRIEAMERSALQRPRWLSVSSAIEQRRLSEGLQAEIFVVPNAVRPREQLPLRARARADSYVCLFVGSFGHAPNVDAVAHFCQEILPVLRSLTDRPVEFVVAGIDVNRRLAFLEREPWVKILGWVSDLEPVYRDSDIVVVPLLTGAGTRIKILEAFSFGRAVVSTPVGAEGLDVVPGRELLVAGGPWNFAEVCAKLLADPARQEELAAVASAYAKLEHSPAAVRRALQPAP